MALFEHLAREGRLLPGATVLESTSGSAGVSCAAIARLLGYPCQIVIPAGGEKAREEAIRAEGAELLFTPVEKYVNGFPGFLKRYLAQHREIVCLNHSMGPGGTENIVTTSALAGIAIEVLEQLGYPDYFIAACGNGSSILGPGRVLKGRSQLIAFESFQSAVAYEILYPGRYQELYQIQPGSLPRHRLPGTSYQGIDFPHIRLAFGEGLVSDVVLVSDQVTDTQYREQTGSQRTEELPHWDNQSTEYGRSTRAGIAVALRMAMEVAGKSFVVIAYDKPDRYDS